MRFDRAGYWADVLKRQFSVHKGAVTCDHYTSVRLGGDSGAGDTLLMVETAGIEGQAGLYGCLATQVLGNTHCYVVLYLLLTRWCAIPGCAARRAPWQGAAVCCPAAGAGIVFSSMKLSALLSNTLSGAVSGGRRCWTPRSWRTPAASRTW